MLRSLMDMLRYNVTAIDGDVGRVVNFLLDDERWAVRYLVVQTSAKGMREGRRVLISPSSFLKAEWATKEFGLALTQERIDSGPSIDTNKPVTREQERAFHRHYNFAPYWSDQAKSQLADSMEDVHLRSAEEVVGFQIQGTDDTIGHVDDFIVDDESWQVRYLVVNTRKWWFGKKVLVAPQWASRVGWQDGTVYVDLPRQTIKDSPEWDPNAPVNREYEARLYDYYGRPMYWSAAEPLPATPPTQLENHPS